MIMHRAVLRMILYSLSGARHGGGQKLLNYSCTASIPSVLAAVMEPFFLRRIANADAIVPRRVRGIIEMNN